MGVPESAAAKAWTSTPMPVRDRTGTGGPGGVSRVGRLMASVCLTAASGRAGVCACADAWPRRPVIDATLCPGTPPDRARLLAGHARIEKASLMLFDVTALNEPFSLGVGVEG